MDPRPDVGAREAAESKPGPGRAARHLRIPLEEYDARIRTFVPGYEALVATAAEAVRLLAGPAPTIVDLGVGTGALAAACVEVRPDARLVGVDADAGMLDAARVRLSGHPSVELVEADFVGFALPPCDAIVACLALHHVPTPESKQALYTACRSALRSGGVFVSADCFPAAEPRLAAEHREAWLAHLEQSYSRSAAEGHLASWAGEDVYFALDDEIRWLRAAGLRPEVLWREGGFAVLAGFPAASPLP